MVAVGRRRAREKSDMVASLSCGFWFSEARISRSIKLFVTRTSFLTQISMIEVS